VTPFEIGEVCGFALGPRGDRIEQDFQTAAVLGVIARRVETRKRRMR
jgi:hypothetical protein